jgi:penicillin-binding protein 1A
MSFFKKIKEIFSLLMGYFNLINDKIAAGSLFILQKIFGKNTTLHFLSNVWQKWKNFNTNLYNFLDEEGYRFKTVRTIYAWVFRGVGLGLLYYFVLQSNFLWLTGKMPSIEQLQNPKLSQASTIISADGEEIGKYFTENRVPVDSAQISPWVYKALIATEDKRFNEHSGIDIRRMGGVLMGILTGNRGQGGGSTISQQLAKNLYNIRRKEMYGFFYYIPLVGTFVKKSKEWVTAIELEKRFTKGEIATLYLNTVDFGSNSFGIKTASKTYFNKTPDRLSVSEAAVLVGLQAATTKYNPIRNPENSKKRRNVVLSRMVQNGDLSEKEGEKLAKKDIVLNVNTEDNNDGKSNYFTVELRKFLESWAEKEGRALDLYTDGLKIYTTIDSRMQSYAEDAVNQHMKVLQKEFDRQWGDRNPWTFEDGKEIPNFIEDAVKKTEYYQRLIKKYPKQADSVSYFLNKKKQMKVFSWEGEKTVDFSTMDSLRYYKRFLQTGMVAFDPYSGFVKAWVGGNNFDYFNYDHVRQGKRQPGSAFKPVVYASAIDGPLNLSPCDRRKDQKIEKKWKENGVEKIWAPKNANGKFTNREMKLRTALARSVNSVAVQLIDEMKPKVVIEYAKKMGIKSALDNVLALALGASDVSLLELAGAYGVFLNEGSYREPIFVYKIEDKSGKVLYEFEPKVQEAIRPESAYLMQFMLRGNVEEAGGTGRRLLNYQEIFKNGGQVAGKTGTTSNNSDAWYMGFTKDLVCGVWVGGEDRSIHFRGSMGEGASSALPIWGMFMNKVYFDKKLGYQAGPFEKPKIEIKKDYQSCSYASSGGSSYVEDSLSFDPSYDTTRVERRIRDTVKTIINPKVRTQIDSTN